MLLPGDPCGYNGEDLGVEHWTKQHSYRKQKDKQKGLYNYKPLVFLEIEVKVIFETAKKKVGVFPDSL